MADRTWRWLVWAGVIAGVVLRVWILRSPLRVLDSDEAVVGLMAIAARHGHPTSFFWGQPYGGSFEAMVTAALFTVVGSSVTALKLVPMALNAASAVVVWRIGRRLLHPSVAPRLPAAVGRRAAALAAVAFWCWPGAYVWWSTKSRGFYQATLLFGLLVLLGALRVARYPRSYLDWVGLGLVGGLAWWQSPQSVFFLGPAFIWLILQPAVLRRWRGGLAALGAFAVGSFPWLAFNARNHLLSLRQGFQGEKGGYGKNLSVFVHQGIGTVAGARVIYDQRWLGGAAFGIALTVAVVVAVLAGYASGHLAIRARRWSHPLVLPTLALCSFTFVHAAFPNAVYVGEGRYLVYLGPLLALGLGLAVARAGARWARLAVPLAVACVVGLVALSAAGLNAARDATSPVTLGIRHVPVETFAVRKALAREGYPPVYADYWVAERLRFETHRRLLTASTTVVRDPATQSAVDRSARVAWVLVAGGTDEAPLRCTFERLGRTARRIEAAGFVVYLPDRPVRPGDVQPCS